MPAETEVRIERDSLGEVRVPAWALYGAQTQRAVENFPVSGLRPYRAFIWSMAIIKRAAAEVNMDLGLLDERRGRAIVQAAQEVIDGQWDAHFVVDPFQAGAGTSHNMNANEVIANRAIEILGGQRGDTQLVHPNDHVNMAQSTNDTIPTAIRLGCLWRLPELLQVLDVLTEALDEKARGFDDLVKSGRTHLQDAVPVRLGQEFGAYARAVEHAADGIEAQGSELCRLGIGGTATGSGLNTIPGYREHVVKRLAEQTGLALRPAENLFEAMQSLAPFVRMSAALRSTAIELGRISNDLRLLASGPHRPGTYGVVWDGRDEAANPLPSGVYIYRLRAENYSQTRNMVMIK
jgi:fumarate hydratase class II